MDKTAWYKRNSYFLATILLLMTFSLTSPSPVAVVNTRRGHTMDMLLPTFKPAKANIDGLRYVRKWNSTKNILLVAARNDVFMVGASPDVRDVQYMERLRWQPNPKVRQKLEYCKRLNEGSCWNMFLYLGVNQEDEKLKVCGSNALTPTCRYYTRSQFNAPSSLSNSLYTENINLGIKTFVISKFRVDLEDHDYQAVFNMDNPVIRRMEYKSPTTLPNWFNKPTFIKLVEYGDKIFIFYREYARLQETHGDEVNVVFSRVAQLCKNDNIDNYSLGKKWDTFLKTRLRCTLKPEGGGEELTLNNLTAVSNVVSVQLKAGEEPVDVVFFAATTPWSWGRPYGTAVCMLKMKEQVAEFFDRAAFMESGSVPIDFNTYGYHGWDHKYYNTVPVKGPEVRPGRCSTNHDDHNVLRFLKKHRIMYGSMETQQIISMIGGEKAVVQIAATSTNGGVDLYLGTDSATVIHVRAGSLVAGRESEAVLVEMPLKKKEDTAAQQDEDSYSVRDLLLIPDPSEPETLAVAMSDQVIFITVKNCSLIDRKEKCQFNPSCVWDGSRCSVGSQNSTTAAVTLGPDIQASTTVISRIPFSQETSPKTKAALGEHTKELKIEEQVTSDAASNSTFYALAFFGGMIGGWVSYFAIQQLRKYRQKGARKSADSKH